MAARQASVSEASQSLRERVSVEEWTVRADLAACYRLIHHYGMTDSVYTHISARIPNANDQFLMNGFGLMFDEVTASNLVKIDLGGNVISDETGLGINPPGFTIHSAIHGARHDVNCILHTHTVAGLAVAVQSCGLLPLTLHAMRFQGRIGYHECEGVTADLGERERLVQSLGNHKVMILRNHGLLTCGATVAEAFFDMMWLERACQAQIAALAGGIKPHEAPHEAIENTIKVFEEGGAKAAANDWHSFLRMLERAGHRYAE
jgi:ribulose-5-phosphate 4-epimerase/fuculose-1-phosphate aldolase